MGELVSVIMSTFNEKLDWIKESIESILGQTYKQLEFIIIIDNPNNVMLKELIYKYQESDNRIKVIQNKENKGLVESLNIAIAHCNGKYIARMDADDISERNRLQKEKDFLEKNQLDFVFSGMKVIDEMGNQLFELNCEELNDERVKRTMKHRNISTHPTWFLKSDVYKNLGGYRKIPYSEDFDFSLRAIAYGYKLGKMKESLIEYRIRSNSISKSYEFEQYMITRKLLSLFKQNKLSDYSYVSKAIDDLKEELGDRERKKYIQAVEKFQNGKSLLKNGDYLKGIQSLLYGVLGSKYHTLKIFESYLYK